MPPVTFLPDPARSPASELRSSPSPRRAGQPRAFTIDCGDCAHRHTPVCDDCVVSFIVGREPDDAVVVDAAEAMAVRLLTDAGLVPGIRHERRAG